MIELTIGGKTARSKFTPKAVAIDFDALPEDAKSFAIRYGLKQYLADGVAGAKDQAEFDTGVDERLAKLLKADFTRTRGEGAGPTDSVEVLAKRMARDIVTAAIKAKNVTVEKEAKAKAIEAYFTANEQKLRKEAEKQIAQRKEAAGDDGLLASLGL